MVVVGSQFDGILWWRQSGGTNLEAVGWNKYGACWVEHFGDSRVENFGDSRVENFGGGWVEIFWMQLGGVFHPTASTVETGGWKAFGGTPVGNFGDGRVENYVEEISRRRKLSGDSFCRLLSAYR